MRKFNSIQFLVNSLQYKADSSKYLKFLLTVYCLLIYCQLAKAQEQDTLAVKNSQIVVMARPQQDGKIMLRWAVTNAKAWRKLNTYGYNVKRYTISRNKKTLPQPVEKSIGVFKPKPLEEWMLLIEENNNAAIMAQSLYGDSFDVEGVDELSAIINLAEEQEQRFTWGLYAADQDYTTAQMAGLGFIDDTVLASEKYVYKIASLVPESELKIEDGGVFIGLQDYEALPKPLDLAGVFLDSKTMLSWNYAIHNKTYNSYFIERSEDGTNFNRLNDLPLTSLNNSNKTDPKRMFYIDSISNGKKYHYRILGKTPFGELSPVSETVSGKGEKILAYVPRITTKNYLDDKSIILEWEFLEEGNQHIKEFQLNRSDKANGKYKVILKNIPPEARKIQYDSLQPTNYMTITAIGKNGSSRTSFPALIQPVDSVPPVKPIGFKGEIDSLGIVTLKWDANKEEDMLGYRVFRGNNKTEEYSQITVSPHRGEVYYDSISVKNLNSKVYYKLIAVDMRFNMSEPSEILEVKKPDFIKPTQPVFKSYTINKGNVNFTWANSSSEDVVKHEIYRKEKDSLDWKLVYTVDSKQLAVGSKQNSVSSTQPTTSLPTEELPTELLPTTNWTDESVEETKQYSYTIIAIDDSELESDPAPPLTVVIPKTSMLPSVEGLDAYIDKKNGYIELYWKTYKEDNVAHLSIYKGINNKPVSLLRNVLPITKRIVDDKVKPNNEYVYMIRAIFKDGSASEIAKFKVKY
ncbi:hypothetical protein [uncultured Polaribacter sp.]|uniref:fibronectin type III domain-containing protein n=1 Tax=uncultured Polaribacter sp. TaxID=174711 RepID=UPI0026261392|nr:hypothetical protein [uncultured Polaribacter sp.]